MKAETLHTQRHLVGLRLQMADAELVTKYVFPFVDTDWKVPFVVVDAMTVGPRILHGDLELRSGGLHTKAPESQLEPITSVPVERFADVVHFDPWWAFRGIGGVPREWIDAVLASNLAGSFSHEGTNYKVHDFVFAASFGSLDALVAKDPVFETVSFVHGDLELLPLRPPPRHR